MVPCFAIDDIITPKKFVLRGLWFGPKKPKRVVVWVHGLGSSAFTKIAIIEQLVDRETAVLAFNNRGFDRVADIKRIVGKRSKWITVGAAHEKYTDCVDDIQGAINFVKKQGIRNIFLAGHSTGCQKSMYWASKQGRGIRGIILLAPVSDYAGALANHGKAKLARVTKVARALVRTGKPHELLPKSLWGEELNDAQRFLSLYTPDSVEEIFSYVQSKKNPRILKSVRIPTFVIWAEHDEFADRPAKEAIAWFEKNIQARHKTCIIPGVSHSFKGGEKTVAKAMRDFMKG
jgi:alpha-beta hydrolase superfamily lysophospholipase